MGTSFWVKSPGVRRGMVIDEIDSCITGARFHKYRSIMLFIETVRCNQEELSINNCRTPKRLLQLSLDSALYNFDINFVSY